MFFGSVLRVHIEMRARGAIQVLFESVLRVHIEIHASGEGSGDFIRTGCSSLRSDLVSRSDLRNVSPDS